MEIKKVCVAGGGLMGRQIALNSAIYGYELYLTDKSPEVCDAVVKWADEYLAGRIEKGRLTEEQVQSTKARFNVVKSLTDAAKDADLVIEAIVEVLDIKRSFFKELDPLLRKDTIIATNSSYMVSSNFADCVSNPGRLANAHYYNPALVMKLVEVVQGPHTDEATAAALMDFLKKTGKTPIWMKKEIDGFVANRFIRVINDQAFYLDRKSVV